MRKALLPLLASLLVCGTATAALIATNARAGDAQPIHKPLMMLAQNQSAPRADRDAGPPPPPDMDEPMARGHGQFCQDIYAHKAGEMAFLEAKLQLAANQQPLFARWKDISLDIAKRREGDCSTRVERMRTNGQRPDMMQRLDREEDMLKTRLADLQAERPALSALYAALNPTQKEEFGRAARHGMGGRMHMAMTMMRHGHPPELGRRLGRGPAGEPPLPEPPPPPAQ
ncbi:MAG TPA: Spy/CpxP family protein refolding chaperone [Rhizomicrobium sp.]|nr:Spy/CpxP family protein refolding chaperone [Rhizomicrobium sp.]